MTGHIRRRGERSWELKFDVGIDGSGKRQTRYHSFKGTKREAQAKLTELIASANQGSYVEPQKTTVGEFVRSRADQWEAAGNITTRTARRYRQLTKKQIAPHIGAKPLQKLTRLDVEAWHTALKNSGLAARTIGHAHRVLSQALKNAESDGLVVKNVCRLQRAPKVADSEMVIVQDVPVFLKKIEGTKLYVQGVLALCTGMRLGEILAIRDGSFDVDKKLIKVREALEETKGIACKAPKSKAGRRDLTLPDIAVEALREHRKRLLEMRLVLGLGKFAPDDLLFPHPNGGPLRPTTVSGDWSAIADDIGMPEITFHALRHTHASQLIASGVDIVTISKRLGHARPSITLAVYAHMFRTDDSKAAEAINAALGNH